MMTLEEVLRQYAGDVAFVVNMSGGKDSVRMLGFLCESYPDVPKYVVYADTGFEHIKPISAEAFARDRTEAYGLPLHTVRNPNKHYLSMIRKRHESRPDVPPFPSASTRQCTSDLKRGPIQKFIRNRVRQSVIINCTGIRAAESSARAKQNPWKYDESLSKSGRRVFNWMPIFRMSLADVLEWHWRRGTPLHPVYIPAYHRDGTTGGYLRRLSCRLCIFSTDADIRAIYEHDPEAFHAVAQLEQDTGYTMKNGKSLLQIINQPQTNSAQYGSEEELPCFAD